MVFSVPLTTTKEKPATAPKSAITMLRVVSAPCANVLPSIFGDGDGAWPLPLSFIRLVSLFDTVRGTRRLQPAHNRSLPYWYIGNGVRKFNWSSVFRPGRARCYTCPCYPQLCLQNLWIGSAREVRDRIGPLRGLCCLRQKPSAAG